MTLGDRVRILNADTPAVRYALAAVVDQLEGEGHGDKIDPWRRGICPACKALDALRSALDRHDPPLEALRQALDRDEPPR